MTKNTIVDPASPCHTALRKLGHEIKDAGRCRRIPIDYRGTAGIHQQTDVHKDGAHDPRVSVGSCATVLFVLGMADRLSDMLILKVTPWASDLKKRIFRNASVQRGTEEA
jgi:hypothetical protein